MYSGKSTRKHPEFHKNFVLKQKPKLMNMLFPKNLGRLEVIDLISQLGKLSHMTILKMCSIIHNMNERIGI